MAKINIDGDVYLRILAKSGYRCGYCGEGLTDNSAEIDFMWPEIRGGGNTEDNLIAACKRCCKLKGHQTVEEFRRSIYMSIATVIEKTFDQFEAMKLFMEPGDYLEIKEELIKLYELVDNKGSDRAAMFHLDELDLPYRLQVRAFKMFDEEPEQVTPDQTIP